MVVGEIMNGNFRDEYRDLVMEFPYKHDDAGWCEMLDENLKCKVYENRPTLCSIEKTWKLKFSHVPKGEYFKSCETACKALMREKLAMDDDEIDAIYADRPTSS
jgi:Fe-S-cluster containining protein